VVATARPTPLFIGWFWLESATINEPSHICSAAPRRACASLRFPVASNAMSLAKSSHSFNHLVETTSAKWFDVYRAFKPFCEEVL